RDRVLAGVGDGAEDAAEQQLLGGVEEREDALLLVGEVLVEGRLRHAGGAADRFGARVGVAGRREDGRGGLEQALALLRQPHLERRCVPAARDCGACGDAIRAGHRAIDYECNCVTVMTATGASASSAPQTAAAATRGDRSACELACAALRGRLGADRRRVG